MTSETTRLELQLANLLVDNTSCCGSEADKVIPMIFSLLNYKPLGGQVIKQTADAIKELLQLAKATHTYCEDNWYSCPKAEDGCSNDSYDEDECICGADKQNERVKELGIILMNDSRLSL